jgi:hypothetical protein
MELLQMLTSQLSVTEDQGLLLKLAKDKLSTADFSKVANAIPGIDGLISSAPASGGLAGVLGGLASSLGGGAGKLGGLASLAAGFKNLDLDSGMIGKFVPIILSFVQSRGGDSVKGLLEKVMK